MKRMRSVKAKGLVENFVSLSLLQGINYVLPLITFPYLFRTLGVDNYGLISLSSAIVSYFNILVSFGFELSATKQVALHRENKAKLSEIYSSVLVIKSVLLLISLGVLFVLSLHVRMIEENSLLYVITFGSILGNVLFPTWFFQGVEKMRYITMISACTKTFFSAFIFIFIVGEDDYYIAPLLVTISSITNGLIAVFFVAYKFKIEIYIPSLKVLLTQFNSSILYFTSRIANNGSRYIATTIIGIYFGNTLVGYYSLVEKLFFAFTSIGGIASQVLYPYVSRTRDLFIVRRVFTLVTILSLAVTFLLIVYNEELLSLVFDVRSEIASKMFIVIFVGAVLNIASAILGFPVLGALGFVRQANTSLIYASLLLVPYLMAGIFFSADIIFSTSTLVVYSAVGLGLRLIYIMKLIPFNKEIWQ